MFQENDAPDTDDQGDGHLDNATPFGDPPLREQIRRHIRKRIAGGQLPPGAKLVERELAQELGVSRIPVREAFRMLETDGFVQVIPRRGVIVRALTRSDLDELFDVREALETLTAWRAAERATPEDLRKLRAHADEARRAVDTGDLTAFGEANLAFHDEITSIARNQVLRGILEPLRGRLHALSREPADPDRLCSEHELLYSAIRAGNPVEADSLAKVHVQSGKADAVRAFTAAEQHGVDTDEQPADHDTDDRSTEDGNQDNGTLGRATPEPSLPEAAGA